MTILKQTKRSFLSLAIVLTLLFSTACGPVILLDLAFIAGEFLVYSGVGYTIEAAIDHIFFPDDPSESLTTQMTSEEIIRNLPHVIPDIGNPLKGHWSDNMTFEKRQPPPIEKFTIFHPDMVRDSVLSEWKLAPTVREFIENSLE